MTGTVSIAWALLAVAVVAAASPVLAGWAVALAEGQGASWWRPRSVRWTQVAVVAAVAVALAAAAAPARPRAAWLMLAAGGAVLSVVDVRTHRLPLPLTISLAASEALVLTATSLMDGDPGRLLRAGVAALVVGVAWFGLVLAAPRSLGLGDVWVAALCAALLGWSGWSTVLAGQAAAWVLAVPLAAAVAATRPGQIGRHMPVPLGPAIIAGAVVAAAWL